MSATSRRDRSEATSPPKEQKASGLRSTQRERILLGMTDVAAAEGYADTTVAKVIAHAGVSRPTFYEYFTDKESCFLALLREIGDEVIARARRELRSRPAAQAAEAAVRALIDTSEAQPARARVLLCEALAAGPRGLDERDRVIGKIAQRIEHRHAACPADATIPDLPAWTLVAAIHWLLSQALRRGESTFDELAVEILDWAASYARAAGEHRWRTLEPGPAPPPSPFVSALPCGPPAALPPGRPRLSHGEVARNQRERILYATAEVASRRGYNAASIAEIVSTAGVDTRLFYAHFLDKEQAFLAAHELGFEHMMAVVAGAFFAAAEWPRRIWRGVLAGCQFQAGHPTLTHLLYVQSYAIGSPAVARIDETHAAFTIFLQEGNELARAPRSRMAMEAIVAACFEVAFHLSRQGHGERMTRMAGVMSYLCLAPFLGPRAAEELIAVEAPRRQPACGSPVS